MPGGAPSAAFPAVATVARRNRVAQTQLTGMWTISPRFEVC
jgi:hypothetical protein